MKGLDTNVLVRYLTQDHQKQARSGTCPQCSGQLGDFGIWV